MFQQRIPAVSVLAFLLLAAPGAAQQGGVWFRFGLSGVATEASSGILDSADTSLDVDSSVAGRFGAGYLLLDPLSIDLTVLAAPHDLAAAGGDLDGLEIADLWSAPVFATVLYHPPLFGQWRPYGGLGVGTLLLFGDHVSPAAGDLGLDDLDFSAELGAAAVVGIDYLENEHWSFFAEARYLDASTEVDLVDAAGIEFDSTEVELDAWFVTLGAGYRF